MEISIGIYKSHFKITTVDQEISLPEDTYEAYTTTPNGEFGSVLIRNETYTTYKLNNETSIDGKSIDLEQDTILMDEKNIVKVKKYQYRSSERICKAYTILDDVKTFHFSSEKIRWTPRILVNVSENDVSSSLMAILRNEYIELSKLKLILLGEYQAPRTYEQSRVRMLSTNESIDNSDEPQNHPFTYPLTVEHISVGTSTFPLLSSSHVSYRTRYEVKLYNGRHLGSKIITYESPDDYPAGEYEYILPSGVVLKSTQKEIREGQMIEQYIGPSSDVICSVTQIKTGQRKNELNKIKVEVTSLKNNTDVRLILPYVGQQTPELTFQNTKYVRSEVFNRDGHVGWNLLELPPKVEMIITY